MSKSNKNFLKITTYFTSGLLVELLKICSCMSFDGEAGVSFGMLFAVSEASETAGSFFLKSFLKFVKLG